MNILVAFDGSKHADAALEDLALAGLPSRAQALVLSVVDAWLPEESQLGEKAESASPRLKELRTVVARRVEAQREIAERGATRLRTIFPKWNVTAEACAESPAVAIIRRAEGENGGIGSGGGRADLTVVGSRGLGPIKRAILGSVARRVMNGLRGSLRVGRGRAAAESNAGAEIAHPSRASRIIVGVDGSADSNAAVEAVAARSWPLGTHILVACYAQGIAGLEHSDAALAAGFAGGGVWSGDAAGASGPIDSWAARTVTQAASILQYRCPGVSVSTLVRLADPCHALVDDASNWGGRPASVTDTARAHAADCIFVGARGVRQLERLLLGSVSAAVAMNAPCSVEIVRP